MLLTFAMFFSCNEKEETSNPPLISNVKVENHDGGTSVEREGTISVNFDATVQSAGRLDYYHIEIHDHPESGKVSDEYRIIDDDFKEKATFAGLKNAHVHEHITVPGTANIGSYHVVITVVDSERYSSDTEDAKASIEIIEKK